jgi:small subunit ribosomal protein S20
MEPCAPFLLTTTKEEIRLAEKGDTPKKKRPTPEKRHIQSEKRRLRNKSVRSYTRTMIKQVRESSDPAAAENALPEAYSALDRAAKKRVIHPNKASRLKSRLAKTAKAKAAQDQSA